MHNIKVLQSKLETNIIYCKFSNFLRILFRDTLRIKFREKIKLRNGEITLLFTDVDKYAPVTNF